MSLSSRESPSLKSLCLWCWRAGIQMKPCYSTLEKTVFCFRFRVDWYYGNFSLSRAIDATNSPTESMQPLETDGWILGMPWGVLRKWKGRKGQWEEARSRKDGASRGWWWLKGLCNCLCLPLVAKFSTQHHFSIPAPPRNQLSVVTPTYPHPKPSLPQVISYTLLCLLNV